MKKAEVGVETGAYSELGDIYCCQIIFAHLVLIHEVLSMDYDLVKPNTAWKLINLKFYSPSSILG